MAQQIINVGSAPNDGTGDVLRNSQIKANANFTELYNDVDLKLDKVSTVDVEKVYIKNADGTQGMKPVSELLSEVLSNDPTTYTAATLPLTGTEVAILNDGTNWVSITWNNIKAQLAGKLVTNATVTGSYAIDWSNDVWDLTLTGNTTLTESNLPASGTTKTITLEVSGNHTLTYPSGWTSKITGSYSGTATLNTITIQYYGSGKYKVLIVQPT